MDVLFDSKNLDFNDCWQRRIEVDLGGLKTNVISATDLIINKEAVGRLQDLADVEKLRIAQERGAQHD